MGGRKHWFQTKPHTLWAKPRCPRHVLKCGRREALWHTRAAPHMTNIDNATPPHTHTPDTHRGLGFWLPFETKAEADIEMELELKFKLTLGISFGYVEIEN